MRVNHGGYVAVDNLTIDGSHLVGQWCCCVVCNSQAAHIAVGDHWSLTA